jgi:PAS domain S-box-containing protein
VDEPVTDNGVPAQPTVPTSSDARERSFLEAALDCVVLADEDGRVVEFNPSAERIFGYSRNEVVGRTLAELIVPPSLRGDHESAFRRFVRTGEKRIFGQRVEVTAMRSDGSEFPAELALSQVEGEPLLIYGAVRDLTDAKQAEEDLRRLADEHDVLRRVATLVARGCELEEVFEAVSAEAARLVGANNVRVVQHMPGGIELTLAKSPDREGSHNSPSRVDCVEGPAVPAEVTTSIVVDSAKWGTIVVETAHPLPATALESLSSLAELAAIAILNTTARSELIASRARIVAAADEARRRVQRDIHDGAQQRLVTSMIHLQLADERMQNDPSAARRNLRIAQESVNQGLDELRDLAAGLHPTILTTGGLGAALDARAAMSALPVTVDAPDARYPAETEVAVYFLVGEALANVDKHARASRAEVRVVEDGTKLTVVVSDDGVGGARLGAGSGLRGLQDRVMAFGGIFSLHSKPNEGTVVEAALPLPAGAAR